LGKKKWWGSEFQDKRAVEVPVSFKPYVGQNGTGKRKPLKTRADLSPLGPCGGSERSK